MPAAARLAAFSVPPPGWQREELQAWLRLVLTPGVGNATARRLLSHISAREDGSAQAIFRASTARLRECTTATQATRLQATPDGLPALLEATWRWLHTPPPGLGHALLVPGDPRYPPALLQLEDPPLMLYAIGPAQWLARSQPLLDMQRSLAVVGTRHPTAQGADNARQFARTLAGMGWCIVSGLAAGVDAAAHAGALHECPEPRHPDPYDPQAAVPLPDWVTAPVTAAVIGTGIDRVYPRQHHGLSHHIARYGFILSEFPLGTPPRDSNFPKRNRIISGLTCGTLVVEAAVKSGSLITARLAAEQGREVFAIPGSIHAPQSRGCHALIRQGAKLVETAQDIMEELAHLEPAHAALACRADSPQAPRRRGQPEVHHPDSMVTERPSPSAAPLGELSPLPKAARATAVPAMPSVVPAVMPAEPGAMPAHPILRALGYDPVGLDALSARTGLDAATLQAQLLELELDGLVAALPGGLFQRCAAV